MEKYFKDFIELLKTTAKDSILVLVESTNYKIRKFILTSACTVEDIRTFIDEYRSVSWTLCNKNKFHDRYKIFHQKMLDDRDPDWSRFPLAETVEDMLELFKHIDYPKGVANADVDYKPFLLVDLDLFDFREPLLAMDPKLREDTEGMNEKEFKEHLKDLPGDVKKRYLEKLVPINLIVTETNPACILFSGNGVHLWYFTPFKMNQELYKSLHKAMRDALVELIPGLKIDEAATMLNQNIRLPYTQNLKGKNPVDTEILYETTKAEVPVIIANAKKKFKPPTPRQSAKVTEGRIRRFCESSRPLYKGLRNIQRDPRLYKFVKENLTFEGILEYVNIGVDDLTKHDDYYMCCSPLRQDEHPSFLVSPSRMVCTDLGKSKEELDYGQLMQKFLAMKKLEFGMIPDTTRYEAELHCVIVAYINYIMNTGSKDLPMCDMKLHEKMVKEMMEEQKLSKPPANMKIPNGYQYYKSMQAQMITWLGYKDRHPEKGPDGLLQHLLQEAPKVYYFYDQLDPGYSSGTYLNNVLALSFIDFINKLGLGVCTTKAGTELYVRNANGLHEPWKYSPGYGDTSSKLKEASIARIQQFLVAINCLEAGNAPPGTPSLSKHVHASLCDTALLDKKIAEEVRRMSNVSDQAIKRSLSKNFKEMYRGVNVSAKDLEVNILLNDHYLEFNNYFVLYDCEDFTRIGEKLINTPETKADLMKKAIVDTRIHLDFPKEAGPTPMFDAYIQSMTYENNHFDKAFAYFTGSMLYVPTGKSRALFLYGPSGDNGKSVLAEVMLGIFGNNDAYITQKSIQHISETSQPAKAARAEMTDAIVNITADSTKEKIGPVFKQLVVGEAVQVRRLYEAERDVRLRCHYLINTNTLPGTHSETYPFKKRGLFVTVDRTIPPEEQIPELGRKIIEAEVGSIWHWILHNCRRFKEHEGLPGFLDQKEIDDLEKEILNKDDLYNFIKDFVQYDPNGGYGLTETTFKRIYNRYRGFVDKNVVRSDTIFDDAELYIRQIFKGQIDDNILNKGFRYRNSDRRGLPLRIFVPIDAVGNREPIDSEAKI
jgi:hypothetical protein